MARCVSPAWLGCLVAFAVLAYSASGEQCASEPLTRNRPKFLWVGDSLTQFADNASAPGWMQHMAWQYSRKADMVNRGFSGYTSRQVLQISDDLLSPTTAAGTTFAAVWLGTNDAKLPKWFTGKPWAGLYVSVQEYQANLRALLGKIKKAGIQQVLLVGPPPIIEEWLPTGWMQLGEDAYEPRSNANNVQYIAAAQQLAAQLGVPFIDMTQQLRAKPGFGSTFYVDALHFAAKGQQAVYEVLRDAIASHFPNLSAEQLPMHWPPVIPPAQGISSTCIRAVWAAPGGVLLNPNITDYTSKQRYRGLKGLRGATMAGMRS